MIFKRVIGLVALVCLTLPVQAVEFDAMLDWGKRVTLSTPVTGMVVAVFVDVGDQVAKGQELLRLDQRVFQAALDAASAGLQQAKSDHAEASRELVRTQDLYDRSLLSDHDLEIAKIAAVHASAVMAAEQKKYTDATVALEYSQVKAPFDGVVIARLIHPGQTAVNRVLVTDLLTLADHKQLLARALVTESQLQGINRGQSATVEVNGKSYQATVQGTGLQPVSNDKGKLRYALEVVFQPGTLLRTGQKASIHLQ